MYITKELIREFEEMIGGKVIGEAKSSIIAIDGIMGESFIEAKLLTTSNGDYFITDNPELPLIILITNTSVAEILKEREEQNNIYYIKKDDYYLKK